MKCPECRFENHHTQKFCGECGKKLEKTCPSCGSNNLPQYKFCGECGCKLDIPSESPPKDLSFDEKLAKIQCYCIASFPAKAIALAKVAVDATEQKIGTKGADVLSMRVDIS